MRFRAVRCRTPYYRLPLAENPKVREERLALPLLSLLRCLSEGELPRDPREVLEMTQTFESDLPAMLEEHKEISALLRKLVEAAKREGKIQHAFFAEKLLLHAETEEEILYPAALLIGKFVKLRFET